MIIFIISLIDSLIGLFIPAYSLISSAVKCIVTGGASLIGTIVSKTAGAMFGPVGNFVTDVLGGIISEDFLGDIQKQKVETRKNNLNTCYNCGSITEFGFFNSAGQRLCKKCFETLSSKIILSSPVPVKCDCCGKSVYEYFIENNKVYCKKCYVEIAMDYSVKRNQLIIVREKNYNKTYQRSYSPNQIQNYIKGYKNENYTYNYKTSKYNMNYKKGY